MQSPSLLSFGEVLWDLFPSGECFGGAPANFACHAALQGANVTMWSAVGNDSRGTQAISILNRFGVDTSCIEQLSHAPTGTVGVGLDDQGKPHFAIHHGSAWDEISWSDDWLLRIARADAIYFGTLGQRGSTSRATLRRALEESKNAKVMRVLDINLRSPFYDDALIRESIGHASVFKLSDDELPTVAKACGIDFESNHEVVLRKILERFQLELIAMTRGAEGAILLSKSGAVHQSGFPVQVVDTVGAGDAFTASMVVGLLRGDSLSSIARVACEKASLTCCHSGAVPNLDLGLNEVGPGLASP